jgi:hypothetical protein
MIRFNFVCHGLMWLVEDGDSIQILIPEIAEHSYRQGQPTLGPGALSDLEPGQDWKLEGVPSSRKALKDLLSPKDALMVKKSAFDIVPALARNRYSVPKPDRIRCFRAVEVDAGIFGSTPAATAHDAPLVSHDVTCLSYRLNPPGAVTIKGPAGRAFAVDSLLAAAWCLYAQPSAPENAHDIGPMNRILRFKGQTGNPDFRLAIPTASDKAHDVGKGTGIGKTHLLNLLELTTPTNSPETDKAGCQMAFVSET